MTRPVETERIISWCHWLVLVKEGRDEAGRSKVNLVPEGKKR